MKGIKNLVKEKKEWQYGHKRYKNLPEHEKQSLVGYWQNYFKLLKKTLQKFSGHITFLIDIKESCAVHNYIFISCMTCITASKDGVLML